MGFSRTLGRDKTWFFLLLPAIAYFLLFFAYPLYNLFYNSLTSQSGSLTGQNFSYLLKDPYLPTVLWVTLLYVIGAVGLEMLAGISLAIVAQSLTSRVRGALQIIAILPLMVPPVIAGLMFLLLYDTNYGPIDFFLRSLGLPALNWLGSTNLALLSVVLADVWRYSPFVFLIIFAALQSVPPHLYEAAMLEGPSRWQMFRHVTLPMIRPALVVALLLDTIGVLKGFDLIYVLEGGGPGLATTVLSYYIYIWGFVYNNPHVAAALSILFLAIVLAIVAVTIKFTRIEEYLGLKKNK
ncbi:MAG: sugar ABC transporter permease [Conexivisphaerales archaeon]